jgi:hypothetical protein
LENWGIKTSKEPTSIIIKLPTRERLKEQKRKGETYDGLINRLIDEKENRLQVEIEKLRKLIK